jgi:hypothetical protein
MKNSAETSERNSHLSRNTDDRGFGTAIHVLLCATRAETLHFKGD